MKSSKALVALIAAAAFGFASSAAFAQATPAPAKAPAPAKVAQPEKKHENHKTEKSAEKAVETATVGKKAPEFSLFDTEGKEHTLSSLAGKIVVLEWFNPECPYVKKHHEKNKTFADLYEKYNGKDVVFFAINSNTAGSPGSGKDRNAKAVKDWGMKYSVLLDESGTTGHAYGANNTPATYVIGKDGVLAYKGAIDDDSGADTAGKTNYVAKALDEMLAGKKVTTSETKAYGCGVKYKD